MNENDLVLTQAVTVISNTVEAKDRYTGGHSGRVAGYAVQIAEAAGYDEVERQKVYYAGLLHDIGKIRIPDAVINKTGRLTEEEFSLMKLHTVAGFHILSDFSELAFCADAAKWHHERYEGTGYPGGLKGEDIPEIARIICVADSYDAMTSDRSYRKCLSQSAVRNEIERNIGKQFDPAFGGIMLSIIDNDRSFRLRQHKPSMKRIMVIDDDEEIRGYINDILKDEHRYLVNLQESGKSAIDELLSRQVDLILLDVRMPGEDGFHVLKTLRSLGIMTPVVFLTGEKDRDTIDKAMGSGASDYLTKPIHAEVLKETLEHFLPV